MILKRKQNRIEDYYQQRVKCTENHKIWEYLQELLVSFYISAEKHILTSLFSRRFFSWQEISRKVKIGYSFPTLGKLVNPLVLL